MTRETTLATEAVSRWLLLEAGDPACNDARDVVASLGGSQQQEATRRAAAIRIPLADTTTHCADESEIAGALGDLRRAIDSLEPPDGATGWFARTLGRVPGIGSSASRHAKRITSSHSRVTSIIDSLEHGRAVLSRDNITLRSDQEQLVEQSARLEESIREAQAFDDALVFAIDVELPFGDLRRPLFEDELLVTVRQRSQDLGRALAVNEQGIAAIESVMATNRDLMSGIDRTRNLTLAGLSTAATAGSDSARTSAAFDEIVAALSDVENRRREALPAMQRTVRVVTDMTHQET